MPGGTCVLTPPFLTCDMVAMKMPCPGLLSRKPAVGRAVGRQSLVAAPAGMSCPDCSQPVSEVSGVVELDHCCPSDQHTSYKQSLL